MRLLLLHAFVKEAYTYGISDLYESFQSSIKQTGFGGDFNQNGGGIFSQMFGGGGSRFGIGANLGGFGGGNGQGNLPGDLRGGGGNGGNFQGYGSGNGNLQGGYGNLQGGNGNLQGGNRNQYGGPPLGGIGSGIGTGFGRANGGNGKGETSNGGNNGGQCSNNRGIIPSQCQSIKNQESYNCAGLAFQTCKFEGTRSLVEETLRKMRSVDCKSPCSPNQFKLFYWPHDLSVTNSVTKVSSKPHPDFHVVAGQTDCNGNGPALVISKNGKRPVLEAKSPEFFEPRSGDAYRQNNIRNQIAQNEFENIRNLKRLCYCTNTLPGKA